MNQKINRTSFWILVMLIMTYTLGACKPAAPAEPTLNPDVIFTQAAETVAAQLTRTALSLPTATNTALPSPTVTATIQLPTATTASDSTNATPIVTPDTGTTPNPNKMAFVTDVTIPDGQVIPPGAKFVKTWRLKNTGTTTWTANYRVRLWAGNSFGFEAVNSSIIKITNSTSAALRNLQTGYLNWNIFAVMGGLIVLLVILIWGA